MDEMWMDILGFEGLYSVSSNGNVKSLSRPSFNGKIFFNKKEKLLSFNKINSGYYCVCLRKDVKNYNKLVHRIVAETFLENIENKAYVNHIDGNKLNNCASNLEWCTAIENINHAIENGLINNGKKVMCFDKNWNFICEYKSATEASKNIKRNRSSICSCARGVEPSCGGFFWKYV